MTVRVLIVDDHPIVRQGLCAVLAAQPDFAVVAECGTGEEAVALAADGRPDVVLMDLRLPGLGGVDATERIVAAGSATAVVVLTTYDSDGDILRAVAAGATGYLLKDASAEELVAGVRTAAAGGTVLAAPVAAKLATRMRGEAPSLTTREIQVLECAARGLSNPETGRELFISEATVKSHMMRIFGKLGVADRTAAVTTALARGILSPP
ncbi:response regulator transcription factor [Nonomuraea fuscirosea]|uniref:response regulator transcription factor n=1 Tax=Nonomuraea fuscirosea TaxID=1291556 RepID=UPI002DD8D2D0|nr:response regulator transcription factor [Nonomuraea fuscirosea]WSA53709.1 response regulator transcription factor [Nonomuraea fuscirosea]